MRTFRWIFSSFFNPMKSNQRFISNSSNRKVRIHCLFVFFRVPLSLCLSVLLHSCLWRIAIAKKRNEQQTLSHKPLVYTHILLLLFNNKRHCDDSSFIINKPSPFLFSFLRKFCFTCYWFIQLKLIFKSLMHFSRTKSTHIRNGYNRPMKIKNENESTLCQFQASFFSLVWKLNVCRRKTSTIGIRGEYSSWNNRRSNERNLFCHRTRSIISNRFRSRNRQSKRIWLCWICR